VNCPPGGSNIGGIRLRGAVSSSRPLENELSAIQNLGESHLRGASHL
jgi:hypothetical protein